jgi:hypothetical protein
MQTECILDIFGFKAVAGREAPIMAAMIVFLIVMYYVAYQIAHAILTEYGFLGGLITCGAVYAIGLIMPRRSM